MSHDPYAQMNDELNAAHAEKLESDQAIGKHIKATSSQIATIADATLLQVDHFVQQAHDLIDQIEALQAFVKLSDDERKITRKQAEEMGILDALGARYHLEYDLIDAIDRIKTAGQGTRPSSK